MIQVFLCQSRCSIPAQFAEHHWFVIDRDGIKSRWEVLHKHGASVSSWGNLHKNFFKPFEGLGVFFLNKNPHWKSACVATIEGDQSSLASHMADFIEASAITYPYRDGYSFTGPNSNTYVQWVLDAFPDWKVTLSRNSIGKSYTKECT